MIAVVFPEPTGRVTGQQLIHLTDQRCGKRNKHPASVECGRSLFALG